MQVLNERVYTRGIRSNREEWGGVKVLGGKLVEGEGVLLASGVL